MPEKTILVPGPDHPITVTPTSGRVTVWLSGKAIADTRAALTLREAAYPAVQYIPRADIDMAALDRSDTHSYCPYKGDASYFGLGGLDVAWSYETPYAAVSGIREHLAFYPDRVEAIVVES